jgi:UMF1 family MFS transporter
MAKNNKRTINAWCMYDWANSAYSLVITATIFPVYYSGVTSGASGDDFVSFFGFRIVNSVLYSYSLSIAFLFIALLLPLLSGIADYGGRRKFFMKFFTYLGGLSCIALYFFTGENVEHGILFSMLACIGFSGGLVFYNAFLPVISTPDHYDMVSARGYAFGYIGSVLLLVFNLFTISKPETFGLADNTQAARMAFVLVGLWWMGFAQIPFIRLPRERRVGIPMRSLVKKGYQEIVQVWNSLGDLPMLKRFLIAYFLYNTGVQTVIYLAALFGDKELKMSGDKLILTILIIQLVAVGGSYIFALLSRYRGNRASLITMVLIWIFVCVFAFNVYTEAQFYILAFIVGLVLGGIQSLSRATYSKLLPADTEDYTSYFSFYDVLEKVSIVLGTFAYGIIEQLTGSMRNSTLALAGFFIFGLLFLLLLRMPYKDKSSYKSISR